MSTFLLEIGTEELPADFARLALPQLEQMLRRDFREARLGYGAICCTSTPRRLAVTVEQLEARTPDLEEERKGPPASQAFRDGVPTPAAIGFANRCGLAAEALEVRDTPKGPFVFATVLEPGDRAIVQRARHPALFMLLEHSPSYYRTLSRKLHWAGSLDAAEPSHN